MPGKHLISGESLCRRCGNAEGTIIARQDAFCTDCYKRFIATKVIKKMEAFRVRDVTTQQPRKLLLAMSFGAASVSLLHVLDTQIERQLARTRQSGFDLHVLHVNTGSENEEQVRAHLHDLQLRYSRHSYHICNIVENFSEPLNISTNVYPKAVDSPRTRETAAFDLTTLMRSLPSATSCADIQAIALRRTIAQFAHQVECEAVLWGSTTTTLAQMILSETAKGRGFALPWLANDGKSPYYSLDFLYPMKDLYSREVLTYAQSMDLPLQASNDHGHISVVSSKDATIDSLMQEYFQSVESNYPSIVANVVKTSSKLHVPPETNPNGACELCGLLVMKSHFGIHGWGGYQQSSIGNGNTGLTTALQSLCYGCARSLLSTGETRS